MYLYWGLVLFAMVTLPLGRNNGFIDFDILLGRLPHAIEITTIAAYQLEIGDGNTFFANL